MGAEIEPRGSLVKGGILNPIHISSPTPLLSASALLHPRRRGIKRTVADIDRCSTAGEHVLVSSRVGIERVLLSTVDLAVQDIPTPGTFVDQGLLFFGAPFRTQNEHLPSRPVVSGPGPFGFEESNTSISEFSQDSSIRGSKEVSTVSTTGIPVSDSYLQHRLFSGSPDRSLGDESRFVRLKRKPAIAVGSKIPLEDDLDPQLNSRLRVNESSKSLPHSSLAPPSGLMGQASRRPFAHYSRSRPRSTELVESGVVIARCASSQPGADRIAPFGRPSDRMGRPLKTVSFGESSTIPCSRAGGYSESSSGLVRPVEHTSSLPLNRQSHLCLLPAVAGKGVISTPVRTDICSITSLKTQSVVSKPLVPQACPVTSRRDAIGESVVSHGYSRQVAKIVASAGRGSTNAIYDGRWKLYTDWCKPRQVNPAIPTGPQLAEFFTYLFSVKKLSYSTLRGYKASIISVIARTNPLTDYAKGILASLFQTFRIERPVIQRAMPLWDLGIVLQGLKRPPFEPIRHSDLRFLSLKTLFLMTLASGARRGEVLALIRPGITYTDRREEAIVYTDPQFIPKTRRGYSSNKPFVIKSLANHVDRDSPDRFLCPVRALRVFLRRTGLPALLKGRLKVFLPLDVAKAVLSPHGHKSQLIAAIEEAYRAMDLRLADEFRLRMHDTRMLAFSLASASGVSLESILTSGSWKSHTTFTTSYLRSMAVYAESLYSLGPLSLPGAVVQPGSHRLTRSSRE